MKLGPKRSEAGCELNSLRLSVLGGDRYNEINKPAEQGSAAEASLLQKRVLSSCETPDSQPT